MSTDDHTSLARTVLTILWGMVTLVLLFVVVLLVYQMAQQGQDPLAVLERPVEAPPVLARQAPAPHMGTAQLYFSDAEARGLVPQAHQFEFSEYTVENCKQVLEALVEGPRAGELVPILAPATRIHAVYLLENGELVIDFSRDLMLHHPKSASAEALMVYGIANTVCQAALKGSQQPAVASVRFLIEGAAPREVFPNHIDVSDPIQPDPRWILPVGDRANHG